MSSVLKVTMPASYKKKLEERTSQLDALVTTVTQTKQDKVKADLLIDDLESLGALAHATADRILAATGMSDLLRSPPDDGSSYEERRARIRAQFYSLLVASTLLLEQVTEQVTKAKDINDAMVSSTGSMSAEEYHRMQRHGTEDHIASIQRYVLSDFDAAAHEYDRSVRTEQALPAHYEATGENQVATTSRPAPASKTHSEFSWDPK